VTQAIPHRDLRNRSSEILRDVQAGASYEITNHGEVMAVIVPPDRAATEALRVRRATVRGGFSALSRRRVSEGSQQVLDDLRGER
jgi:prevent-host-death family protein